MIFLSTEQHIKKEREKGRTLRQSRWWQNRIQNGALCYYCNLMIKKQDITMDHIVPLSQGGTSSKGNCVPACKSCNTLKRSQTAVEFVLEGQGTTDPDH